ncbi:MAG: nitroreductase family protein [Candidatus Omnitrophica bacterium]|nr:nitroreductase family protein [Candidatus Omnitrophota bacterium]
MDFNELIENRESLRDYDPNRPLDEAVLKRILNAGRLAPSAANKQPWRFLVVSSKKMLDKVRPCYNKPWFKDAPHILIIVGDRTKSWIRQLDNYNSIETDLTIAMDHIILSAENEGVGACWIAAFDNNFLRQTLALKENECVFSITPLGYSKKGHTKIIEKKRKSLDEIVEIL